MDEAGPSGLRLGHGLLDHVHAQEGEGAVEPQARVGILRGEPDLVYFIGGEEIARRLRQNEKSGRRRQQQGRGNKSAEAHRLVLLAHDGVENFFL